MLSDYPETESSCLFTFFSFPPHSLVGFSSHAAQVLCRCSTSPTQTSLPNSVLLSLNCLLNICWWVSNRHVKCPLANAELLLFPNLLFAANSAPPGLSISVTANSTYLSFLAKELGDILDLSHITSASSANRITSTLTMEVQITWSGLS